LNAAASASEAPQPDQQKTIRVTTRPTWKTTGITTKNIQSRRTAIRRKILRAPKILRTKMVAEMVIALVQMLALREAEATPALHSMV
jgi:hypothetical protein